MKHMTTTYERLSQPKQAAQAVRDYAQDYSEQAEVVVRVDILPDPERESADYAWITISFAQTVPQEDNAFRSHYSPVFEGLQITAVASRERPQNGFYDWKVVYNGDSYPLHAIDLRRVKTMHDTLAVIDRALDAARDKGLNPGSFATYVTFVANVLGVRQARICRKGHGWRWADMGDVVRTINGAEDAWRGV